MVLTQATYNARLADGTIPVDAHISCRFDHRTTGEKMVIVDDWEKEDPIKRCNCGSGLPREEMRDGYDIFLTYCCEKCRLEKRLQYRSDIFDRYEPDGDCIDYDY